MFNFTFFIDILPEEEVVTEEPIEATFFICKLYGIKLNKEAAYCPQCGTSVKKK